MKSLPPYTVPGAEPVLLRAGPTACLLLHGFTAQPEEMQYLAADLHGRGYSVLTPRLAGHGTQPRDLERVHWSDWLLSVEDSLDLLSNVSDRIVLIGQSMGAMLALAAAAEYPPAAVVALSTPYFDVPPLQFAFLRAGAALGWMSSRSDPRHAELGDRRKADYPAYARYPLRVFPELISLQKAMRLALPKISVPALLVQSRADRDVGADSLDRIHAQLGSSSKEKLWVEGMGHSLVWDEKRQQVFDAIGTFLKNNNL
jgi:carboxylesterase